jgi:hypothetical protein
MLPGVSVARLRSGCTLVSVEVAHVQSTTTLSRRLSAPAGKLAGTHPCVLEDVVYDHVHGRFHLLDGHSKGRVLIRLG